MTRADLDALLVVHREGAQVGLGNVFPQEQHPFPTDAVQQRWKQEMSDPGLECFVVVDSTHSVAGFAAMHTLPARRCRHSTWTASTAR